MHEDIRQAKALWDSRKEYGSHDAFILGAMLDHKHYGKIEAINQDDRIKAEVMAKQLCKDPVEAGVVVTQLKTYRRDPSKLGIPEHAFQPGIATNPLEFWADYGAHCKKLAALATRIMSIPPTAAFGERNFSVFSHIWSDSRNRLLVGRVGLLVYIYFNVRVLNNVASTATAFDWDDFMEHWENLPTIDILPGQQLPVEAEDGDAVVLATSKDALTDAE